MQNMQKHYKIMGDKTSAGPYRAEISLFLNNLNTKLAS